MSLFETLIDRRPKLRLFLYSPAEQAIELASRAFPAVQPRPKLTDAAPLIERPVNGGDVSTMVTVFQAVRVIFSSV